MAVLRCLRVEEGIRTKDSEVQIPLLFLPVLFLQVSTDFRNAIHTGRVGKS
jgi:hypothetical protein